MAPAGPPTSGIRTPHQRALKFTSGHVAAPHSLVERAYNACYLCGVGSQDGRSSTRQTVERATPNSSASFSACVLAAAVQLEEVLLVARRELGLLAAQAALGLGDLHAFARARAYEIGFELGEHGRTLKSSRPTGSVGSCTEPPRFRRTRRRVRSSTIVALVGQRASEAIELAHDKCVAGAAGGGRLTQAGPVRVGPGESVIDVDALRRYAARLQTIALGGEVLGWGRRARSRPAFRPPREVGPVYRTVIGHFSGRVLWDTLRRPQRWRRGGGRPSRWGFGGLRDGRCCLAWRLLHKSPSAGLRCRMVQRIDEPGRANPLKPHGAVGCNAGP